MLRIVLGSLALLFAAEVAACQCGARPSLEQSLEASAIFEGTIVDKRVVFARLYGELFPAVEYKFAVSRSWKGVSSQTVWLLGGYSNCASHFWGNQRYLVFASPHWEKPGALSSSICSRTRPIAVAGDDLRDLGPAQMVFIDQPHTKSRLPLMRLIRAHAVAGVSGFVTLSRSPNGALDYLGVAPLAIATMCLGSLLATLVLLRSSRKAAFLAAICFGTLLLIAVALAGRSVLRNPYFGRFVEWQAPADGA